MDLSSTYLGMDLRNPLVASASPLSQNVAGVQRLADAGVGAVVLPSLFEEQLRREAEQFATLTATGTESFAESLSYLPATPDGRNRIPPLPEYASTRRRSRRRPGHRQPERRHPGGWTDYAARCRTPARPRSN